MSLYPTRIQRDQLFLYLHKSGFFNFVKQGLHILPNFMRKINYIVVKLDLSRDIGINDPNSIILLSVDNKLGRSIKKTWNHNFCILPETLTFQQSLHVSHPKNIVQPIQNYRFNLGSQLLMCDRLIKVSRIN